jgi:leader peptidase (prepilin peptidase)/N-methyltransferase
MTVVVQHSERATRPAATVAGIGLGALLAVAGGDARIAPTLFVLGLLLVAVVVPDLRERRIPNRTLMIAAPLVLASVVLAGLLHDDLPRSIVAVSCGTAMFGGLLLAAVAVPTGLGMGDVKLVGLASVALGWFGLQAVLLATAAAFGLAGVVGLGARRRGRWVDGVPFAPFYAIGASVTAVAVSLGA